MRHQLKPLARALQRLARMPVLCFYQAGCNPRFFVFIRVLGGHWQSLVLSPRALDCRARNELDELVLVVPYMPGTKRVPLARCPWQIQAAIRNRRIELNKKALA